MSEQPSSEQCLNWIAQRGSQGERGMEILFRAYGARLKAFFRRHRMSEEETADLLQETFIKVYRAASQFQGQAKASTWLWSIARNCLLDHVRARQPAESLDEMMADGEFEPESASGPACEAERLGMRDCIERGFDAFGEQHPERAEVMRLVVFEEWSMHDIAAFLARTPAATREYISQCRKRLRQFLDPCRDLLEA